MGIPKNDGELLQLFVGQRVAILCARYWYRGFLRYVGEQFLVLSTPFAVERTGPATGEAALAEDPIPSLVVLSRGAIEVIIQPTWAFRDREPTETMPNTVELS